MEIVDDADCVLSAIELAEIVAEEGFGMMAGAK
jgi:hypothetical protein